MCRYNDILEVTSSVKRKRDDSRSSSKRIRLATLADASSESPYRDEQVPHSTPSLRFQVPGNHRDRTSASLAFPSRTPHVDLRNEQLPRSTPSRSSSSAPFSIGTPPVDFRPIQIPAQPPFPPKQSAGVLARADQVVAKKNQNVFSKEIARPIQAWLDMLQGKCITCLLSEDRNWETHNFDDCPTSLGVHNRDHRFSAFRDAFKKLPNGWCWFCIHHQKQFNHPLTVGSGPKSCRDIGQLVHLAYAYFILKCRIIAGYPKPPPRLREIDDEEFASWALGLVKPEPYTDTAYLNLHHLFLWAMRELRQKGLVRDCED